MPENELELGVLLWATTPQSSERQDLLGAGRRMIAPDTRCTWNRDTSSLSSGDGGEAATLQIEAPGAP